MFERVFEEDGAARELRGGERALREDERESPLVFGRIRGRERVLREEERVLREREHEE